MTPVHDRPNLDVLIDRRRAALDTDRAPAYDPPELGESLGEHSFFFQLAPAGSTPCRQHVVVSDSGELITSFVRTGVAGWGG